MLDPSPESQNRFLLRGYIATLKGQPRFRRWDEAIIALQRRKAPLAGLIRPVPPTVKQATAPATLVTRHCGSVLLISQGHLTPSECCCLPARATASVGIAAHGRADPLQRAQRTGLHVQRSRKAWGDTKMQEPAWSSREPPVSPSAAQRGLPPSRSRNLSASARRGPNSYRAAQTLSFYTQEQLRFGRE